MSAMQFPIKYVFTTETEIIQYYPYKPFIYLNLHDWSFCSTGQESKAFFS